MPRCATLGEFGGALVRCQGLSADKAYLSNDNLTAIELLAGRHTSSRACPYCGHPPEDVGDEDTVVTDVIVTDAAPATFTVIDGGK